ncbi:MAG: DUF4129 domain-containing protein [Moorea sp. SIO2I5]|nr:DUF4129 domain-containing protein [Moorena sp. SIO2I5]
MSTGSFEKNSLDWQLQLLQRQFGEWWELKMSQVPLNPPQGSLPSWLLSPIVGQGIRITFWLVVAVILSWLGVRLFRGLHPYIISYYQQLTQAANRVTKPPVPELSVVNWWERSQNYQQQGNYREACRCLYMGMLQQLHDTGIAPRHPSRTDGEYLQLIQQLPQPKPYQILLITHQQLCFSNAEVSSQVFERCQQAYQQIKVVRVAWPFAQRGLGP